MSRRRQKRCHFVDDPNAVTDTKSGKAACGMTVDYSFGLVFGDRKLWESFRTKVGNCCCHCIAVLQRRAAA